MFNEENCGNCEYHHKCKELDGAWTCDNENSDQYGLETDYNFSCDNVAATNP